jgi:hypothetical protein
MHALHYQELFTLLNERNYLATIFEPNASPREKPDAEIQRTDSW